jgi:glycosyltransferase involved in cell wall biosynthesis
MLAVDLTPTTINRTAIFHIALDTSAALPQFAKTFRYGRSYVDKPITDYALLDSRKRQILDEILGKRGLAKERWHGPRQSTYRRPGTVDRIFFFDPLYTLFEDIRQDDVVLVLDLTTITNPEWHNPHVSMLYNVAFRKITASGARLASISESTAKALWANYGVPPNEILVVPLYVRRAFESEPSQDVNKEKKLLFVGSLETRKNIHGLIKAFSLSRLEREGFQLVIAGGDGVGAPAIKVLAASVRGVDLRGFVSDDQLKHLYRTSLAFVYPSYLEGFGVPILEAASAGLPILTSITGATGEVAPPGSILVDPYNTAAIANGLRQIAFLSDTEFAAIAYHNQKHAAGFSFDRYFSTISSLLNLSACRT